MAANNRRVKYAAGNKFIINSTDNPYIMSQIYKAGWSASPDGITAKEAAAVTALSSCFIYGNTTVGEDFDSFKYFTGLTNIAGRSFYGNKYITNITIPDSVISIGDQVFRGATALQTVVVPDSVTTIGNNVFRDSSITSIELGKGITELLYGVQTNIFTGLKSLTRLVLKGIKRLTIHCTHQALETLEFSDCLEELDYNAFNAPKLAAIDLPSTVVKLGYSCFLNCNPNYIIVRAIVPPVLTENNGVYRPFPINSTCPIYVPDNSVDTYKAAIGWTEYADRIKPLSELPTE